MKRFATFLVAVAIATPVLAQSVEDSARAAILVYIPHTDLEDASLNRLADCHIDNARNQAQLDGLAAATSYAELAVFLNFATIEARYCAQEVTG